MRFIRWIRLQYVRRRLQVSRKEAGNASANLLLAIWSHALLGFTRNAQWLQLYRNHVEREAVSVRYIKSDYIKLGSIENSRGATLNYYLHPRPPKSAKRRVVLTVTRKGNRVAIRETEFTKLPYGQIKALSQMAEKLVRQLPREQTAV